MAHRVSLQRRGRESALDLARLDFHDRVAPGDRAGLRLCHPLAWVRARLWRSSLDAALICGEDPCRSPALAYRSARLTSKRGRHRLAAALDRVVHVATQPARGWSAAVVPCREEVVAAGALLVQARDLLQSDTPVYAQGAARLERLLRDGGGPLYWPSWRGALQHELGVAIAALEGRDATDGMMSCEGC